MRACCAATHPEPEVVEGRLPEAKSDTRFDTLANQVASLLRTTEEIRAERAIGELEHQLE